MSVSVAVGSFLCFMTLAAIAAVAGGEIPRPEHPRPDFKRNSWLNLNGKWEFAMDVEGRIPPEQVKPDMKLDGSILVPFCPESKLSGVGYTDFIKHVMYRRRFRLPDDMRGKRLTLHFGASDWEARVWLNGRYLGAHRGGYTSFSFEITEHIVDGENEVFVSVRDDTRSGLQATGKQSHKRESYGCVYTRTTGIWQTVWLEAVGETYLREFSIVPDIEKGGIVFRGWVDGSCEGCTLRLEAFDDGKPVAREEVPASGRSTLAVLTIPEPRLWQPESPFLYDLKISLIREGETVDEVSTYFGLRKVHIDGNRILINNKPVFQRLILDQGFYPDGIYTAPSDEALKRDIELSMAAGFNGARLHQKVFEPRFLYWADKLGYLVWGEFADWGVNVQSPEAVAQVVLEWKEVLRRDRNHPSIIGWCPLNETGWSKQAGMLQKLLSVTQTIDPTRPFLDTSGYCHLYDGADVYDTHDYTQDAEMFRAHYSLFAATGLLPFELKRGREIPYNGQPYFVSEYGGIHIARPSERGAWGYGKAARDVDDFLKRYRALTEVLLSNPNMFGFCYTQLTDVEQEQNGIYYYDRTPKFDVERLREINQQPAAYETEKPRVVKAVRCFVLNSAAEGGWQWRFKTDKPAENWFAPGFDDSGWREGKGGFGTEGVRPLKTAVLWDKDELWLRAGFTLSDTDYNLVVLMVDYLCDAEIYINGERVKAVRGDSRSYVAYEISNEALNLLKGGENLLAVHARKIAAKQYIDVGLRLLKTKPKD